MLLFEHLLQLFRVFHILPCIAARFVPVAARLDPSIDAAAAMTECTCFRNDRDAQKHSERCSSERQCHAAEKKPQDFQFQARVPPIFDKTEGTFHM